MCVVPFLPGLVLFAVFEHAGHDLTPFNTWLIVQYPVLAGKAGGLPACPSQMPERGPVRCSPDGEISAQGHTPRR
jgi:hypothetical protein